MFNTKLCIQRPIFESSTSAPFAMLSHKQGFENKNRFKSLARSLDNQYNEGYNTVNRLTNIKRIEQNDYYTHLLIDVDL
jgi:hypothetical protein